MTHRMRNDWVLVRMQYVGNVKGIEMPQSAVEGKVFFVEAIGPDVKDLEIGEKIIMRGTRGVDYFPLPNATNLFAIQEEYVVLVFEEETEVV